MKLPDVRNFDLVDKRVLLRTDYDVPLIGGQVVDETRIQNSLPTLNHLLSQKAKVIILTHLGRPEGKVVSELSLKPVSEVLSLLLGCNREKSKDGWQIGEEIFLKENLRFEAGEEDNDLKFAQKLADLGDFYVNEAFAVCHREHASVVGLPKLLPHAAGLSLLKEVEVLSGILEKSRRPVVVILGGIKEDKLEVVEKLSEWADYILIGGKLPTLISNFQFPCLAGRRAISNFQKIIIADLNKVGKDVTLETVEKFIAIIRKAATIVWTGPMGQYESEDEKWEVGTREIGKAVVNSGAFTVIGGGDTEAALTKFGLVSKINFVSSGGGAMLEFLAEADLPGLKALRIK